MELAGLCFRKSLRIFALVLNWHLRPKLLLIMAAVVVVSLLVVAGVGRFCLFMVISGSPGILKKIELNGGRT